MRQMSVLDSAVKRAVGQSSPALSTAWNGPTVQQTVENRSRFRSRFDGFRRLLFRAKTHPVGVPPRAPAQARHHGTHRLSHFDPCPQRLPLSAGKRGGFANSAPGCCPMRTLIPSAIIFTHVRALSTFAEKADGVLRHLRGGRMGSPSSWAEFIAAPLYQYKAGTEGS
jgi:hypothetical protein